MSFCASLSLSSLAPTSLSLSTLHNGHGKKDLQRRLATKAELPAVIVPQARAEECAVGLWLAVHKLSG